MVSARAKAGSLGDLFMERVETRCVGKGLALASPREARARGGQVSFTHPRGWAVMQNLIARGVIGDFRDPDVLRLGFAPAYLSFADIAAAARHLAEVLASGEWQNAVFRQRAAVT